MAEPTQFEALALPAIDRGLLVCRLKPGDKRPLSEGWLDEATDDKAQVSEWAAENPSYNCGAVVKKGCGYWVVDIDSLDFLTAECPREILPKDTYAVETGGGGRHYYFKGDGPWESIKHVPNPDPEKYKKPDGSECKSVIDIICHNGQVLVAGNVHPKSKKPYKVKADKPLAECPPEFLSWLRQLVESKTRARTKVDQGKKRLGCSPATVAPGWEPEELAKAGLKHEKPLTKDGKVFFNYHVLMGKCLVKNGLHVGDGGGNENNPECSAFVWDPSTRQLWHKCQTTGCSDDHGSTEAALLNLGLDPDDVFYKAGARSLEWIDLDKEEGEHVEWLWPTRLATNRLVLFCGDSTQGKSPVVLDLISRISTGADWPDGTPNKFGPRKCILLSAEDDLYDTVIPRLEVMGANKKNIKVLKASVQHKMTKLQMAVSLETDVHMIDAYLTEHPDEFAFIGIDPVTSYMGSKTNMNSEINVRTVLQPVVDLAQKHHVSVATVGHINKRSDVTKAGDRAMGARAFRGLARGVFYFDADPDDPNKYAHVMVAERLDAKSLKYKTVTKPWTKDGKTTEQVVVEWGGESEATIDDIGAGPSTKDKNETKLAGECLGKYLQDGQKPVSDCKDHLEQNGFEFAATGKDGVKTGNLHETRVKKAAKVESARVNKVWVWRLKDEKQEPKTKDMFDDKENGNDC